MQQLVEFKLLLGDKIVKAVNVINSYEENVDMEFGNLTIRTPWEKDLAWIDDLLNYIDTTAEGKELLLLPIQFLKFNDRIGIWSAPLELFCEISNEIRDKSPFPYTLYFGYINGNFRYLTTKEAYLEGGYEPNASPFSPSAAGDLISGMLNYFQNINN